MRARARIVEASKSVRRGYVSTPRSMCRSFADDPAPRRRANDRRDVIVVDGFVERDMDRSVAPVSEVQPRRERGLHDLTDA